MSHSGFDQPAEQKSESHKVSDAGVSIAIGKIAADAYSPGKSAAQSEAHKPESSSLPSATFKDGSIFFNARPSSAPENFANQNPQSKSAAESSAFQKPTSPERPDQSKNNGALDSVGPGDNLHSHSAINHLDGANSKSSAELFARQNPESPERADQIKHTAADASKLGESAHDRTPVSRMDKAQSKASAESLERQNPTSTERPDQLSHTNAADAVRPTENSHNRGVVIHSDAEQKKSNSEKLVNQNPHSFDRPDQLSRQLAADIVGFGKNLKDAGAISAMKKDVSILPNDAAAQLRLQRAVNTELQSSPDTDGTHHRKVTIAAGSINGELHQHINRPLGREGGDTYRDTSYSISKSGFETSQKVVLKAPLP